jgi:hypothetical protein
VDVLSFMVPCNDSQLCLVLLTNMEKIFMITFECYQYSLILYILHVTEHDPSKTATIKSLNVRLGTCKFRPCMRHLF